MCAKWNEIQRLEAIDLSYIKTLCDGELPRTA